MDEILLNDHKLILSELAQVNETLAQVMSRLSAFGPIACSLAPAHRLSDFAVEALVAFDHTKEECMLSLSDGSGVQFGNSGSLLHPDQRFLKDDMDALEVCGYIAVRHYHDSYNVYSITRAGSDFARQLPIKVGEQEVPPKSDRAGG